MDDATERKIIEAGKRDYFAQGGVYTNRYPPGTEEFNAYERGWMQSLKYNDGRLINLHSKPIPKPQPKQSTVNLYALMKGRDAPRK